MKLTSQLIELGMLYKQPGFYSRPSQTYAQVWEKWGFSVSWLGVSEISLNANIPLVCLNKNPEILFLLTSGVHFSQASQRRKRRGPSSPSPPPPPPAAAAAAAGQDAQDNSCQFIGDYNCGVGRGIWTHFCGRFQIAFDDSKEEFKAEEEGQNDKGRGRRKSGEEWQVGNKRLTAAVCVYLI
jgi:hypothetical protein